MYSPACTDGRKAHGFSAVGTESTALDLLVLPEAAARFSAIPPMMQVSTARHTHHQCECAWRQRETTAAQREVSKKEKLSGVREKNARADARRTLPKEPMPRFLPRR